MLHRHQKVRHREIMPAPPRPPLSKRQGEVLDRLRKGESNKEIAAGLGIAYGTVRIHVVALFRKLGARNRTEAAMFDNRKRHR
jgi:two-component system, NarL family, nitrate/nitrite response regulator NarL